jgi:2-polyprenyl-3-methyl-5-hydroxy-6-metoxy-1,4-benzoquinol methylase
VRFATCAAGTLDYANARAVTATLPNIEEYAAMFAAHGDSGAEYLRWHFARFVATKQRLLSHGNRISGNQVLDVGAHWLHQALLYAIDGFAVTALDLPATLEIDSVRALAEAHSIRLLPNADLEYPSALKAIADDTFDIVLFTEVIEHLAFNPVAMWREIYRVMKPGARIVVTTPNYHALRTRVRQWWRALRGLGAGVDVEHVLGVHTLGHHWKEYSRRELVRYFSLLSPDFACRNFAYSEAYRTVATKRTGTGLVLLLERMIPFLRPDLYVEIELTRKAAGIVVEPHW